MHSPMRPRFSPSPYMALRLHLRDCPHSPLRKRTITIRLTEAQVEKIREAGIDPNERIKLYTEYPQRPRQHRQKPDQSRQVRCPRPSTSTDELQDVADADG